MKKLTQKQLAERPETDASTLRKVAKKYPDLVVSNPNCPLDVFIAQCKQYPVHAEMNPLVGLIAIEDPIKYKEILSAISEGWLSIVTEYAPTVWVDVVERYALPLWKESYPDDTRFAYGCDQLRDWVKGNRTLDATVLGTLYGEVREASNRDAGRDMKRIRQQTHYFHWTGIISNIITAGDVTTGTLTKLWRLADQLSGLDIYAMLNRGESDAATGWSILRPAKRDAILRFAAARTKHYWLQDNPALQGMLLP